MGGVFGFDSALLILKAGGRVTRIGWGGRKWVFLTQPSAEDRKRHPITSTPYLAITMSHGHSAPAELAQTDLLAEDWFAEYIEDLIKETK